MPNDQLFKHREKSLQKIVNKASKPHGNGAK